MVWGSIPICVSDCLTDIAALRKRIETGRLKDGRALRIRKPSRSDPEQELIYQKLRIDSKKAFLPVKSFAKP